MKRGREEKERRTQGGIEKWRGERRILVGGRRRIGKWRRRRNVIWRGIEGRSEEERKERLETIVEKVLGKKGKIIRIRERRGAEGGRMLIVEFEEEEWQGRL